MLEFTVIFNSYHNKVALTIAVSIMVFVAVNQGNAIPEMEWAHVRAYFETLMALLKS